MGLSCSVTKSLTPAVSRAGVRSTEGTDTGHENTEGMACVGGRLTAQLGWDAAAGGQ